jgi:predicted phosphodiesterase
MLIALLADIHANREALAACFAHAQSRHVDRFVFLGDLVGYGADPAWVVERVIEHVERGAIAVLGNHDAAVVWESSEGMRRGVRKAVDWTRDQLTPEHRDFLAKLPKMVEDGDNLYVHANAWSPYEWEYVLSATEARESLLATRCRNTFCGHVHEPALYHINQSGRVSGFVPVAGTPIPLSRHRRWLAIPGSVGQPRDGVLAARYAVFETEASRLTYCEVPYDYQTALLKTVQAGLPPNIVVRPPVRMRDA